MLVNKDAYQRETLTEWPVRLPLRLQKSILNGWQWTAEINLFVDHSRNTNRDEPSSGQPQHMCILWTTYNPWTVTLQKHCLSALCLRHGSTHYYIISASINSWILQTPNTVKYQNWRHPENGNFAKICSAAHWKVTLQPWAFFFL